MRPVIFEVDKQPRDPLQAIGGLYQWLKERVNEVEYNESVLWSALIIRSLF